MKKISFLFIFLKLFNIGISEIPYSKNDDQVYYAYKLIKGADAKTFEILDYSYAKDINNVYFRGKKLKNTDLKTFEVLSFDYAKDINNVYSYGKKLNEVDPETFEILKCPGISMSKKYSTLYTKDKNNIYYMDKIVTGYISKCGIGGLETYQINLD